MRKPEPIAPGRQMKIEGENTVHLREERQLWLQNDPKPSYIFLSFCIIQTAQKSYQAEFGLAHYNEDKWRS